jgi:signal peptidase I
MFRRRNLRKIRKLAQRWLTRARRDVARHPQGFSAADRAAIDRGFAALDQALLGDDPERIAADLNLCRRRVDQGLPFYRVSWVRENVETIAIALALALFIRAYVIQTFKIPSGSMIPTLLVGDQLVVNKFTYGVRLPFSGKRIFERLPRRGDIIVFRGVDDPNKDLIKRVVGLPGDVIEVHGADLLINSQPVAHVPEGAYNFADPYGGAHHAELDEEDLEGVKHPVLFDHAVAHSFDMVRRVPEESFFCMGDNRDHSSDSRVWGFVPMRNVKGRAMVIHFSWPPTQWKRIGTVLK